MKNQKEFKVYSFETKTGIDYRIDKRRAGSIQVGLLRQQQKAKQ